MDNCLLRNDSGKVERDFYHSLLLWVFWGIGEPSVAGERRLLP